MGSPSPRHDDPAERRDFVRIPFQAEVEVRAAGRTVSAGGDIDVSMNGLRLSATGTIPPEHTPCEARIMLGLSDDGTAEVVIKAAGTIVRSEAGTLAVHFTEIDPESYQHLSRLILLNADDPEKAEREFLEHAGIRSRRR